MLSRRLIVALSSVVCLAALATTPSAVAVGDEVVRGACDGASTWRLRVFLDSDLRLAVIGSVYSEGTDVWRWRMKHNGDISSHGEVRAKNARRSFRIKRRMIDLNGSDAIVFRAKNTRTGQICRGELAF